MKSSWSTTAPPTAARSSSARAFPAGQAGGAAREPRLRRRLERRLPRGAERHRGAAEQRHAGGRRIFWRRCSKASPTREVFAVSCQIFFSDPAQAARGDRPDAGLVAGRRPARAPSHRPGDRRPVSRASTAAADRAPSTARKFLELGGFDPLLAPFYLEDTDLGYMAWKRGWKVLYQPRSVVYHEHRGTIGKRFSEEQIQAVLKKNFLLFCWKNIHEWPRLAVALLLRLGGRGAERDLRRRARAGPTCAALWRAFRQLPRGRARRAGARASLAADQRHGSLPAAAGRLFPRPLRRPWSRAPERLRVLFVSPYPICPPVHGGGVFMYQTLREMAKLAEVHVVGAAGLAVAGEGQPGTARRSARRPSGWCGPAGSPRAAARCCRTPCASSPTTIWSG